MRLTKELLIAVFTALSLCLLLLASRVGETRAISLVKAEFMAGSWKAGVPPEPLPDLTVKEIKIMGTGKVKVMVKNIGDKASAQCLLSIKVFAGITSKLLYSTRIPVPAIAPQQSKILFFNTMGRPLDGNSINAVIDSAQAVKESREDNNEENLITAP